MKTLTVLLAITLAVSCTFACFAAGFDFMFQSQPITLGFGIAQLEQVHSGGGPWARDSSSQSKRRFKISDRPSTRWAAMGLGINPNILR